MGRRLNVKGSSSTKLCLMCQCPSTPPHPTPRPLPQSQSSTLNSSMPSCSTELCQTRQPLSTPTPTTRPQRKHLEQQLAKQQHRALPDAPVVVKQPALDRRQQQLHRGVGVRVHDDAARGERGVAHRLGLIGKSVQQRGQRAGKVRLEDGAERDWQELEQGDVACGGAGEREESAAGGRWGRA
eukprot:355375-Chlamydomonas_euryale.AAC.4